MVNIERMREWYEVWSKKPKTKTALKAFKRINPDQVSFLITLDRIAVACFNARHYDHKLDPGECYREKIAAQKKHLPTLQKAARVLAESAERNDKALNWAYDIAENASGVRITRKEHNERKAHHLVMKDFFSELEIALKGKLPEIHGGPFLHKFTKGNLIFEKPIAGGPKVTKETMLAFELAFYLRMLTAGRAEDSPINGQPMPDDGDPCFPVVAKFCSAVFDTSWDAKQIGDNVRALKNPGLTGWQGVNFSENKLINR